MQGVTRPSMSANKLELLVMMTRHDFAETASFDPDRYGDGEAPITCSNHPGLAGLSDRDFAHVTVSSIGSGCFWNASGP